MSVFIHVFESYGELGSVMLPGHDADKLNAILETIQQKGGKIIDIKVAVSSASSIKTATTIPGVCRVYLIIYEAKTQLL